MMAAEGEYGEIPSLGTPEHQYRKSSEWFNSPLKGICADCGHHFRRHEGELCWSCLELFTGLGDHRELNTWSQPVSVWVKVPSERPPPPVRQPRPVPIVEKCILCGETPIMRDPQYPQPRCEKHYIHVAGSRCAACNVNMRFVLSKEAQQQRWVCAPCWRRENAYDKVVAVVDGAVYYGPRDTTMEELQ